MWVGKSSSGPNFSSELVQLQHVAQALLSQVSLTYKGADSVSLQPVLAFDHPYDCGSGKKKQ